MKKRERGMLTEKKRAASRVKNLGKPLLILSALTTLSVPSVHVALATSQQTTENNVSDQSHTDDGSADRSASSGSASAGASSASQKSAVSSSASESVSTNASSGDPSSTSSASSATDSMSTSQPTTSGATTADGDSQSEPSASSGTDTSNAQNNEDPSEPNKATNTIGSTKKTVSAQTVAKANIKTIQATSANYTAIKSTTSTVTTQFIAEIGASAQRIAAANDLYASVMIAQAILESASGQSGLAQNGNNLFGIKGTYNGQYVTMNTSEYVNGKWVEVAAQFRKYPSLSASLQDYANLLKNGLSYNANYYAKVWKTNAATYEDATKALQGTYATDPSYASKLNKLISTYQLTKYDSAKSSGGTSGTSSQSDSSADSSNKSGTTSANKSAVGKTVKTNGILYASSDAASSVKTSLTTVQVKKVYSGAKNPYQVTHNGVVVGYLRSVSAATTRSNTTNTSNTTSSVKVGTTVKTNGIIYLSSTARDPLITSLTKVQVSKIFSAAKNKYQVKINGVIVGYLRFATPISSSSSTAKKAVGTTLSTNGKLYVSSTAEHAVSTSLKKARISKIFTYALNPYQVEVDGVVVGYLR